ncbi:hypothetical protein FCS83_09555 [Oenococcus sp. UCMA 17063]|nr:hypothetical protein [Oenococcus sp. UCMA 17063]
MESKKIISETDTTNSSYKTYAIAIGTTRVTGKWAYAGQGSVAVAKRANDGNETHYNYAKVR